MASSEALERPHIPSVNSPTPPLQPCIFSSFDAIARTSVAMLQTMLGETQALVPDNRPTKPWDQV